MRLLSVRTPLSIGRTSGNHYQVQVSLKIDLEQTNFLPPWHTVRVFVLDTKNSDPIGVFIASFNFGPARIRTAYLLIANEAFYQVNYGPVVGTPRLELGTFSMSTKRSNQLSYVPEYLSITCLQNSVVRKVNFL